MCLKKFCALFAVVALCSFAFVPLDVGAYDISNSKTLTVSEAVELFGETLAIKYFDGTDYQTTTATLSDTTMKMVLNGFYPSAYEYDPEIFDNETQWIFYDIPSGVSINSNPSYLTVDFTLSTTYKDTEFLCTCLAVANRKTSTNGYNAISDTYPSATWDMYIDGVKNQYTSSDLENYIVSCSPSRVGWSARIDYTFIPVNVSFSKSSTIVSSRACFYGTTGNKIAIRIPTVSLDAVAENGDTSGSGSGSGGSGGSVDLGETNGLLGNIIGWLQGVFDAITGLPVKIAGIFLPDDTFLDDWRGTVSALWSEHFGAFIIATDTITDIFSGLTDTTARTSIDFPVVTVPLAGTSWTFGGWSVPLKPVGFDALYTALALAIDLICTIAFVNMLHRKYEKLVSGGAEGAD